MGRWKRRASFMASGRLGSYLPTSSALMVCRLTSSWVPRSAWDQPRSARSWRKIFFIGLAVAAGRDERAGQPRHREHRPHEEHRDLGKVRVRFEEAVRERHDRGDEEGELNALALDL